MNKNGFSFLNKSKGKQRTGTGAIRRLIPLLKPEWEITKISNRQNTRWNITETLTPKQATENHIRTTALERSVINYWGA